MNHKPTLTLAFLLALPSACLAQSVTGASLDEVYKAKLKKKLAGSWLKDPKWVTDYDEAKERARKTGKVILGYFTKSYAY